MEERMDALQAKIDRNYFRREADILTAADGVTEENHRQQS